MMATRGSIWLAGSLAVVSACTHPELSTMPVRLVDGFANVRIEGTPAAERVSYAPSEWRFVDGDGGWRAIQGVMDVRVEKGALHGRTSSAQPILAAMREGEVPDTELLHAVEVRARVSAGSRMTLRFDRGPELVLPRALGGPLGALETPIRAGDELQTYLFRASSALAPADIQHVLLIPTNAADAEFEIESIRLVFRGEHLRSIPSGVGWHGMSEIYRESIVTRSPEKVVFEMDLPRAPSLELAVATIEDSHVTFRTDVTPVGSLETRTFRTLVTRPDVWHSSSVDLDGLDGRKVEVALSLVAETPGVLGFWGAPAIRSNAATHSDSPQGVVLVITDTLRSDHLALGGYERNTAPTLTRLAQEGAWFSDVISQATWTKVSVTSIQSSLYPTTHTVGDIPDRLPASATTIAEVYRNAGYATLALTTIPFVGQLTNLHQGYEVLHESGSLGGSRPKSAHELVGRLLPWLEAHRETPFFVLLHVADPHSPFRPPNEYETTFAKPGDMDRLDELIEEVKPHIRDPLMKGFGMPRRDELRTAGIDPDEFVRHELDGYDGSIRGMDDALARLVHGLEELGLTERSLIAVVSDHGTEFLEHDAHFHGHTVYGELNRVPMLIWGTGSMPSGVNVDVTVQTIDLMPTLLELSGLPIPDGVQGESLVPLLTDNLAARWNRPAITESLPNLRGLPAMTAFVSDGFKLIRIEEAEGARYELYDHRNDPLNLEDVADENPDVVERLAAQIDRFREFAAAARLDDRKATEQMDSEELDRLRSLGYVQ